MKKKKKSRKQEDKLAKPYNFIEQNWYRSEGNATVISNE